MVKKKFWVNFGKVDIIICNYLILFIIVPILSFCFSFLAHSSAIGVGTDSALKSAILNGLKWYGIIMPIITILFFIWFLFNSDTIEFTGNSIKYCRSIFSKKLKIIPNYEISEVVISDGLWYHSGNYDRGRKIIFYSKGDIIFVAELYYKLCLSVILAFPNAKIRIVDEDCRLKTLDNYFKIDFKQLSYEQQLNILKYYCKTTRTKYKTGEEILSKKRK